jgi:hypothetical protein
MGGRHGCTGPSDPPGISLTQPEKRGPTGVDFGTTFLGGCQPFPNEVSPMRLPHGTAINGRISETRNQKRSEIHAWDPRLACIFFCVSRIGMPSFPRECTHAGLRSHHRSSPDLDMFWGRKCRTWNSLNRRLSPRLIIRSKWGLLYGYGTVWAPGMERDPVKKSQHIARFIPEIDLVFWKNQTFGPKISACVDFR